MPCIRRGRQQADPKAWPDDGRTQEKTPLSRVSFPGLCLRQKGVPGWPFTSPLLAVGILTHKVQKAYLSMHTV